jgi:hypothetical protein
MPVVETVTLTITCDNPGCPGNTLNPADRRGWTFVNAEIYGGAPVQYVYCSPTCAEAIGGALELLPPVELPPPEPGL